MCRISPFENICLHGAVQARTREAATGMRDVARGDQQKSHAEIPSQHMYVRSMYEVCVLVKSTTRIPI